MKKRKLPYSYWFSEVCGLDCGGEENKEELKNLDVPNSLHYSAEELVQLWKDVYEWRDRKYEDIPLEVFRKYSRARSYPLPVEVALLGGSMVMRSATSTTPSSTTFYYPPQALPASSSSSAAAPLEIVEEEEKALLLSSRSDPLPENEVKWINKILNNEDQKPDDTVLSSNYKIDITVKDIMRLREGEWLQDKIVEFYVKLVATRKQNLIDSEKADAADSCYSFTTLFFTQLASEGYAGVEKWTMKAKDQIFSAGKLFFPVHAKEEAHWYLLVLYTSEKRIASYDSLDRDRTKECELLLNWFSEDSTSKRNVPILIQDWKLVRADCPRQRNGDDCGVHVCINTDYLSDSLPLQYTAEEVSMWRKKIAYCILKNKICH